MVGGWNIFVEKYLLLSVITFLSIFFFCFVIFFFVFFFFFVCLCVTTFCGPFLILFWCYLIKKQNKYYKKKLLRKKSQLRQFTWLVATESTQKKFWIISYFFCFCQHFTMTGIFSAFSVKLGFRDFMDL